MAIPIENLRLGISKVLLYDIKCVRIQKERGHQTVGKKMLFIFNPKAGKGKIKTNLLDIVDIFSGHDYEIIIRATQAPKDAYQKAKEYADSVDLIV